ncbi:hypothetical protein GCM10009771_17700 [Nesterenkonia flava]
MHAAGVGLPGDEIIARLTAEVTADLQQQISWRPGARELVAEFADLGVPQAIVATSPRNMAATVASRLPEGAILQLVAGEDVDAGNPAPDPHLRAARLCGADPRQCLAVEDSPTALTAAVAAGTLALAVPHDAPIPEGDLWAVLPSLEGVGARELMALVASRSAGPRS